MARISRPPVREANAAAESRAFFTRPAPAALFLLAFLIVAAAAALSATRALRDRSNLLTGGASWIWHSVDLKEPKPARFFAGRDFTLVRVPPSAKAMVFVDRRGVIAVNGSRFPLPEQRPGSPLAVLEIAPALVAGGNRVVIEAESPTGAGGILFHLDLPGGERVDSDATWRVSESLAELARGAGTPAGVWGRPPMYPWGYPRKESTVDRWGTKMITGYAPYADDSTTISRELTRLSSASRAAAQYGLSPS